jgi:hypothetical protein
VRTVAASPVVPTTAIAVVASLMVGVATVVAGDLGVRGGAANAVEIAHPPVLLGRDADQHC